MYSEYLGDHIHTPCKQCVSALNNGAGNRYLTSDLLIANRVFELLPPVAHHDNPPEINCLVVAPHAGAHPQTIQTGD